MRLDEFLSNPVGKGDASLNIKVIRQALDIKYNNYSKKKDIKMQVFHQPLKDIYWVWMIIPSETERNNSYDVVYKFINPNPKIRTSLSIGKFDIQVFANSPSFAYTYSYVYNKYGLLIPTLSSKLGKTFMTKSPGVRNRNQIIMFDKYIYFGASYILDSKVLNRAVADLRSHKYDENKLNARIRTLSKIMDEYKTEADKLRGKKQAEKDKKKGKQLSDTGSINRVSKSNHKVNTVGKVGSKSKVSKKVSSIKKK